MKYLFPNFGHARLGPRRAGFALVVALTAIVLITVIVLAFFSKALLNRQVSFTSTNQIKSDMLARTALDIVVGEVRQEILDYSSAPTNGIYQPLASSNMVPIKTGVNAADTNTGRYTVAKVAAADTKIDPGNNGKLFGSAVGLDQKSRNGRTLSQWFNSGPGLGSATLPVWTYLSRAGTAVTNVTAAEKSPTGTNYVTGRFSFTVYNVGGLLDANVAGYPSTITNTIDFGVKSSIAYADLTILGMTANQVDDLVAWRNAATGASTNLFKIWATGINSTNTPAGTNATTAAASGYLEAASGDNVFFSRRDLLRYLSARATTDAIPSLTHFSRALTAPTWGPANVVGSSIDYGDDAGDTGSINRLVPEVLAFDGVITDYADDGTSTTREVTAGESLVQRKFSLAKLAWIGHDGPNAAAFSSTLSGADRNLAIKTCFGLTWKPNTNPPSMTSNAHWEYDHGSSNDILILDEIRKAKRAPDFFELLKAGILHGSLGGQPGTVAADISAANNTLGEWAGPIGRDFEAYSADEDRHVLQIGANIIDQADANNYPTAIYMDLISKYAGTEGQFFNTVFGLENLPMLQRMGVINSMVAEHTSSAPYPTGKMAVWMQPELWNPNEKSTAGTSPLDVFPTPSAIRLVTYGKSYVWNAGEYPTDPTGGTPVDFGRNFYSPSIDGIICIKNPSPDSTQPQNLFDTPRMITGFERASNAKKYDDATCPSGPQNRYPAGITWVGTGNASNQFMGVFIGDCERDPNTYPQYDLRAMIDGYLTFVMEYYDGSRWRPYGSLSRLETLHGNKGSSSSRQGTQFILSTDGHIDPRTSRFSGSAGRTATGANTGWGGGSTVRSSSSTDITNIGELGRSGITVAWPRSNAGQQSTPTTQVSFSHNPVTQAGQQYLFDDWAINLAESKAGKPISQFRYTDPDGVTRPGDSWRADYSTGDGVMTYHRTELPASSQRRRAVIMNRPFRSVGELGYVFRDQPFKTLDLWSADSPDAGLLDLFEVSDKRYAVTAGQVNANVATPKVMESLFSRASSQTTTNSTLSAAMIPALAQSVTSGVSLGDPLRNSSDLVSQLSDSMVSALTNNATDTSYQNKSYGEAPLRALSSVTSTRTWNLLVDVVAQSGKLAVNASGLQDFLVEGERRYWLHLAVDRFTGEVVDQQLETVYE